MGGGEHSVYCAILTRSPILATLDLVIDRLKGSNVGLGFESTIMERMAAVWRCLNGIVFCPTFLTWISSLNAALCVEDTLKAPVVLSEDNTCSSRCMGTISREDFLWCRPPAILAIPVPQQRFLLDIHLLDTAANPFIV